MTETKHVANTLKNLINMPLTKCILNRSSNIDESIDIVSSWWNYDLFSRKPSPAYDEYGIFNGTDLDLACFLYALAGRGSVINIPNYKPHSRTKIKEGQQLTSKYNRHGEIISVGANKDFFSFNLTMIDQNVIGADKVGDYRTFSLTNKLGEWYEGWKRIEFVPTLNENRFITENKLWSGNKIIFKNFIHPNRWTSFFGYHYIVTKMLIDRLTDYSAFLNTEIKRLQLAGVTFPSDKGPKSESYDYYGKTRREKFPAFEVQIFIPKTQIEGDYTFLNESQEQLVWAYQKRKQLVYNIIPKLRFMTRASEYAHFKNPERMPAWLKNVKWEDDFAIPGGRKKWQRMKLFQPEVGQHAISILKRTYEKSAEVNDD